MKEEQRVFSFSDEVEYEEHAKVIMYESVMNVVGVKAPFSAFVPKNLRY